MRLLIDGTTVWNGTGALEGKRIISVSRAGWPPARN
jgi:hypothetical protein